MNLDDLLHLLDKIQGLSSGALACFSCIVVGYILKAITKFPNGYIPVAVILFGSISYTGLTSVFTFKNIIVGFLIGFIAWQIHYWVLHYIEDKFTAIFGKPKPAEETDKNNEK